MSADFDPDLDVQLLELSRQGWVLVKDGPSWYVLEKQGTTAIRESADTLERAVEAATWQQNRLDQLDPPRPVSITTKTN